MSRWLHERFRPQIIVCHSDLGGLYAILILAYFKISIFSP